MKHGDTKVPQHYKGVPGLGKWVAKRTYPRYPGQSLAYCPSHLQYLTHAHSLAFHNNSEREQHRLLNQGKHSFLTADRLEKLNAIDFVWTVRSTTKEEEAAASTVGIKNEANVKAASPVKKSDHASTEEQTVQEV
jgi:hypothetical protein